MRFLSKSLQYAGLFLICLSQLHSQTVADCKDYAVTYGSAPAEIDKKISISHPGLSAGAAPSGRRVASPQGTGWFIEVDPDYMSTKLPWTTTLYLGGSGHTGVYLQTSFTDHDNTFSARWLNEKLIFIQVWWGRIASSDLILDVAKGQFIYNEFAHYGQLIQPCE